MSPSSEYPGLISFRIDWFDLPADHGTFKSLLQQHSLKVSILVWKLIIFFSSSQVQMWELDHKEVECQRTDAFELWHWIGLLRVLWTAGRSNQSILKEINSEYSLEGLMLKLKLQYFNHLMLRANSLEKTLMLGKIEAGGEGGNRLTDDEIVGRHHWLSGHEFEQTGR